MIAPKNRARAVTETILVLFIITLTFFPAMRKATIYRDDWYYAMDRLIGGPQVFPEMFRIDRPVRGYFFEGYYRLFGIEPAPYHLTAFGWRLLTGLSALWLFRRTWPRARQAAVFFAILLVIFPGYTRWLEGFEDQPKIVSLFLQVTSFVLTLEAINAKRGVAKMLLWLGSILTGWSYLALIDYAIGMEVFRYLCIYIVAGREQPAKNLLRKAPGAIRVGLPALLIAGGFLFWRIFLFENQREATDIGLQLGALVEAPLLRGMWWLIHLFRSMLNVAVLSWASPFFQELFSLRLREILIGLLTALTAAAAVFGSGYLPRRTGDRTGDEMEEPASPHWQREAVVLGMIGVLFGVLPVIMANRVVSFGAYSHYAVPASLASATLITGLVAYFPGQRARFGTVALLVFLAVASQYAAAAAVLHEEEKISAFWHQVVWRAPGIQPGTTLAVIYPTINYGEDIDTVNGPANLLYFPETTNQIPAEYHLFALKQTDWTSKDVLGGGEIDAGYRTHFGRINYDQLLVISQPTEAACVRVIDQRWPWYASSDDDSILLIGHKSNIQAIITTATPPLVPAPIFGPEPAHDWCYYFQKASLALQMEDWEQVRQLGDKAIRLKLHPQEVTEWIPFVQAYAMLGDAENIKGAASKINQTPFNRVQACNVMGNMKKNGYTFAPQVENQIAESFCSLPK